MSSVVIPSAQGSGSARDRVGSNDASTSTFASAEARSHATGTAHWIELQLVPESGVPSVHLRATNPYRNEIRSQVRNVLEPYQVGIMKRRNELIEKEFAGTLTTEEDRRLRYLRWQLDQLEDATRGPALDLLQAHAARRRDLASAVASLVHQLQAERPTAITPRHNRAARRR